MDTIKILVVDDKTVIGNVFELTLGQAGHEIVCVNNGQKALEAVQKKNFDIVFQDIHMPGQDGVAILAALKKQAPDLPVVMMSGFALEGKKEEARKLGAVACLKKPFDIAELRKVVKLATGKEL